MQCKLYILAWKTLLKRENFSDENPPTEKDLQEYFNIGDEVKNLLQPAVSRAKRTGITRVVLLSCINDCYQVVTSFLNIALPPDLDDILNIDPSMEGESSTIKSCLQGMNGGNSALRNSGRWSRKSKHDSLHRHGRLNMCRNICGPSSNTHQRWCTMIT